MADNREATATSDDRKHIFPFFNLARELRDSIYDECTGGVSFTLQDLHIKSEEDTITDLLFVSRQFQSEYEDRIRGRARLTLTDLGSFRSPLSGPLPAVAKRFTTVEVHLVYIFGNRDWLRDLTRQLSQPTNLNISVLYPSSINVGVVMSNLSKGKFHTLPGIRQLDILVRAGPIREFDLTGAQRVIFYDQENRCFKTVEAA